MRRDSSGPQRALSPRLSVDVLRRSSPHNPTRTLRLSEHEHPSRDNTPIRLENLTLRPRSRNRTPLRYESPLEPSALRRDGLEAEQDQTRLESARITIRPNAGAAVGDLGVHPVAEKPKSLKQGYSHRKVRRWNNDNFTGLAAEIKASRGHVAAEALLRSQEDAHLYKDMYDPTEKTNSALDE